MNEEPIIHSVIQAIPLVDVPVSVEVPLLAIFLFLTVKLFPAVYVSRLLMFVAKQLETSRFIGILP